MAENFQDDGREDDMRQLFNLYKDDSEGRSGIDAFLDYNGQRISFELKTTSNGSVTTVRDFGADHIKKWKDKHWLIGFFIKGKTFYKYGSPSMMAPWILEKELYIKPDFMLADITYKKIELNDLYILLGKKEKYTFDDAKSIHKKQYKKEHYLALQDLDGGYSPIRMLDITKDRAKYLMERGSTLNNPHIPLSYFDGWVEITENHAIELRKMVGNYLEQI